MEDAFGSPMSGGKAAIDASIAKQKETVDKVFAMLKASATTSMVHAHKLIV